MMCEGITKDGRRCKRPAAFAYGRSVPAGGYTTVAGYCKAHHDGRGVMRLLRPLVWEYSIIRRIDADGNLGETVYVR